MFLSYNEWADFIEWIAEVEKWPYFEGVVRENSYHDNIYDLEIYTKTYIRKNEQWFSITFNDRDNDCQEYDFKLSTLNQLYKDYKENWKEKNNGYRNYR